MSTHHLLWTSGWDSTFRLLDLLIIKKKPVQPYYLLDSSRKSMYLEFQAMKKIRNTVFKEFPHTQDLLQKTTFVEVSNLKPNEAITQLYRNLKKKVHMGSQYEWLALFAEESQIPNLEISIEKYPDFVNAKKKKPSWFDLFVYQRVERVEIDEELVYKVTQDSEAYHLFKYFTFPVMHLDKLDFAEIAKQHGFRHIMDYTWFCHRPIRGKPCGMCVPCGDVMKVGFTYRLPLYARMLYHAKKLIKG
ncbi:MAG: hypothetical protein MUE81_14845 [Thermoflexibacter sp.]|jgi:hypothetical protein|nr:hypothetical protein [Thermoflexibacter sp.]